MPTSLLSVDFLSICLLCTDGDVHIDLKELFQRIEKFQDAQGRQFGVSKEDFRGAVQMLCWETGIWRFGEDIGRLKFADIVGRILEYHDVYFNDEGEHWSKQEVSVPGEVRPLFGLTEDEYEWKVTIRRRMNEFFAMQEPAALDPESVRSLLRIMNVTRALLDRCSTPD